MSGKLVHIVDDRHASADPAILKICQSYVHNCVQILAGAPLGSGFFPGDGHLIVTDWHVVEEHSRYVVRGCDEKCFYAGLYDVDKASDLALISIRVASNGPRIIGLPSITTNVVSSQDWRPGTEVVAIGFPTPSATPHVSPGTLMAVLPMAETFNLIPKTEDPYRMMMVIDAIVPAGMSGGPVFRLSDGALIGVVSSSNELDRMALVSPAEELLRSLNFVRME